MELLEGCWTVSKRKNEAAPQTIRRAPKEEMHTGNLMFSNSRQGTISAGTSTKLCANCAVKA
ncbi:hypothetical protein LJR098_003100 [Rhizobium sp. LjRoot98]|uniref:hypothetical protein n=1 Tax=unclassified Rhizobium TaxID=2613769 RepID=UPI00071380BB|nr:MULTISPECIES: hypothetical protein [unclassified Rhizobium]KQV29559.1 hypothetical protein ASC96_13020 [Rhizobium sp. Root1204]